MHAAERVKVTLPGDLSLWAVQRPRDIPASRVGVGAVLWDGALVLAAHVARLPAKKLRGARCLELGAGVGLVGIAAALRGARVAVTDIRKVLPLLEENLVANGLGGRDGRGRGGRAAWEDEAEESEGEGQDEAAHGEGDGEASRANVRASSEDDASEGGTASLNNGGRAVDEASSGTASVPSPGTKSCSTLEAPSLQSLSIADTGVQDCHGDVASVRTLGAGEGASSAADVLAAPASPQYDPEIVQSVAFPDPFVEPRIGEFGAISLTTPGDDTGASSAAPFSAPSAAAPKHRPSTPPPAGTLCTAPPLGSSGVCMELEWGKPGYLSLCSALSPSSAPLAYVFAADVCYVDGDGESPSTEAFARACDAVVGQKTVLLVAQERRAEAVRQAWKAQAEQRFESVRMLSSASLPEGLRVPHIDVWELKRGKKWKRAPKDETEGRGA